MTCVLKRVSSAADARPVIELNRIHGNGTLLINPDLIEVVEACPDTVITLVNKHRYLVAEPVEEVVEKIVAFRARIAASIGAWGDSAAGARTMQVLAVHDEEQAA